VGGLFLGPVMLLIVVPALLTLFMGKDEEPKAVEGPRPATTFDELDED